jgi:hypothetical protein
MTSLNGQAWRIRRETPLERGPKHEALPVLDRARCRRGRLRVRLNVGEPAACASPFPVGLEQPDQRFSRIVPAGARRGTPQAFLNPTSERCFRQQYLIASEANISI